MKTKIFFIITLFSVIVYASTTTTMAQQPQQPTVKSKLSVWYGEFPVQYGDPMSFFNEFKIENDTSAQKYIYKMEDGPVHRIPDERYSFTIPANTSGVVSKYKSLDPNEINVCFFADNDNYIIFSRMPGLDGFYAIKAVVFVDGLPYEVDIQIRGNRSQKCRLLYDLRDEENPDDSNNIPGIVPNGVKEIRD